MLKYLSDKPRLKKFQNTLTTLTINKTGVKFHVGDAVSVGARVHGLIVAFGADKRNNLDGTVLLSTGEVVEYQKMRRQDAEPLPKKPRAASSCPFVPARSQAAKPPQATKPNCTDAEYKALQVKVRKLEKELEECTDTLNSSRTIPAAAASAPADIIEKLPEIRQQVIRDEIELSVELLTDAVQAGDTVEVKIIEKGIEQSLVELKDVATQQTISATANCRIIISNAKGKETVRMYFAEKPDTDTYLVLAKNGFKSYYDTDADGKRDYYYGAWNNPKNMKFATEFCKSVEPEPTATTTGTSATKGATAPATKGASAPFVPLTEEEMGDLWGAKRVAAIRAELNAAYPDYKFSVTKSDSNGVYVTILSAPIKLTDKKEEGVNQYYIKDTYKGQVAEVLSDINRIMSKGITYHETGDYGTQPDFYTHLNIGSYDKPFVYAPNPNARITNALTAQQPSPKSFDIGEWYDSVYSKNALTAKYINTIYYGKNYNNSAALFKREMEGNYAAYMRQTNSPYTLTEWFLSEWLPKYEETIAQVDGGNLYPDHTGGNDYKHSPEPTTAPSNSLDVAIDQANFATAAKEFFTNVYIPTHNELDLTPAYETAKEFMAYLHEIYRDSGSDSSKEKWFEKVWMKEFHELVEHVREEQASAPKFFTPPPTKEGYVVMSDLLRQLMPKHQQDDLSRLPKQMAEAMQDLVDDTEENISDIEEAQEDDDTVAIVKAHYTFEGNNWYITEYQGNGLLKGIFLMKGEIDAGYSTFFTDDFKTKGLMDLNWQPRSVENIVPNLPAAPQTPPPAAPQPSERDAESAAALKAIREAFTAIAATATARANGDEPKK